MRHIFIATVCFISLMLVHPLTGGESQQIVDEDNSSQPDRQQEDEAQEQNQEAEPLELSDLSGKWVIESIEMQGEVLEPRPGMPDEFWISSEGVFNADSQGTRVDSFSRIQLSIDTSTEPMQMNFVRSKNGQAETLPGIFKLEEGQLSLAMPLVPVIRDPDEPLERPKSFDTTKGSFLVMFAKRFEADSIELTVVPNPDHPLEFEVYRGSEQVEANRFTAIDEEKLTQQIVEFLDEAFKDQPDKDGTIIKCKADVLVRDVEIVKRAAGKSAEARKRKLYIGVVDDDSEAQETDDDH